MNKRQPGRQGKARQGRRKEKAFMTLRHGLDGLLVMKVGDSVSRPTRAGASKLGRQ